VFSNERKLLAGKGRERKFPDHLLHTRKTKEKKQELGKARLEGLGKSYRGKRGRVKGERKRKRK